MGAMIALPHIASQIPGKYLSFLVTKDTDKQHLTPKSRELGIGLDST